MRRRVIPSLWMRKIDEECVPESWIYNVTESQYSAPPAYRAQGLPPQFLLGLFYASNSSISVSSALDSLAGRHNSFPTRSMTFPALFLPCFSCTCMM